MKKASEYRQHALERRTIASARDGEAREQLLEMAATWERMAEDRTRLVRTYPDLALSGEVEEEPRQGS